MIKHCLESSKKFTAAYHKKSQAENYPRPILWLHVNNTKLFQRLISQGLLTLENGVPTDNLLFPDFVL